MLTSPEGLTINLDAVLPVDLGSQFAVAPATCALDFPGAKGFCGASPGGAKCL